jgi:hypothetical protein
MESLHAFFQKVPMAALFVSLAIGYWVGKIKIGNFQLGGMTGTLLAGVPIGLGIGGGCLVSGLIFGWLRGFRRGCRTALDFRLRPSAQIAERGAGSALSADLCHNDGLGPDRRLYRDDSALSPAPAFSHKRLNRFGV